MGCRAVFALVFALFIAQPRLSDAQSSSPTSLTEASDASNYYVKLTGTYKRYSFFPTNAYGIRSEFSYIERSKWGIRANFFALHAFDQNGFQLNAGASYWFIPDWVLSIDAGVGTNPEIITPLSIYISSSYSISKVIIPSLAVVYAREDIADSAFLVPSFLWRPLDALRFDTRFFAGYSFLENKRHRGSFAGSIRTSYTPIPQLVFHFGGLVGNIGFDRFIPTVPLIGIYAGTVFGAIEGYIYQGLGVEGAVIHEWRSNEQKILTLRLAFNYRW